MHADLGNLVAPVVASIATTGFLVFLLRTWISERLRQSIQHEYDLRLEAHKATLQADKDAALESLRAEFARHQSILATAQATLLAGRQVFHDARLKAISELWRSIVRLGRDSKGPSFLTFMDLLLPSEYDSVFASDPVRGGFQSWNQAKLVTFITEDSQLVEWNRPLIGDLLYRLYYAYRILIGRTAFLLLQGFEKKHIEPWQTDKHLRSVLSSALGSDFDHFDKLKFQWFSWAKESLERKIASHITRIIGGEEDATSGMEQAMRIANAVRDAEIGGGPK